MYRYQLHLDDCDKYQYNEVERITDDTAYWMDMERSDGSADNIAVEIFDSISQGMHTRDLLVRYGCEYAHNIKNYKALMIDANNEEFYAQQEAKRNFNELFSTLVHNEVEISPFSEQSKNDFFLIFEHINRMLEIKYNYTFDINNKLIIQE